jgi:hypothetical protein
MNIPPGALRLYRPMWHARMSTGVTAWKRLPEFLACRSFQPAGDRRNRAGAEAVGPTSNLGLAQFLHGLPEPHGARPQRRTAPIVGDESPRPAGVARSILRPFFTRVAVEDLQPDMRASVGGAQGADSMRFQASLHSFLGLRLASFLDQSANPR